MPEETPQERLPAPEPSGFVADLAVDLTHVVRGEVREPTVLEVGPHLFRRVEFGGVGGQPGDVPAGMGLEPGADRAVAMRPAAIPEQDEGVAIVPIERAEEVEDLRAADIGFRMEREGQGQSLTVRRNDQRAEPRNLFMPTGPDVDRRRDAAAPPCAPQQRLHEKARLIRADQAGALATEFFLPGASPPGATAECAVHRALWRGVAAVAASDRTPATSDQRDRDGS